MSVEVRAIDCSANRPSRLARFKQRVLAVWRESKHEPNALDKKNRRRSPDKNKRRR